MFVNIADISVSPVLASLLDSSTEELYISTNADLPRSSEGQSPDKAMVPERLVTEGRGGHAQESQDGRSVSCQTKREEITN